MNNRVTPIDTQIARTIKAMRKAGGLTQPQVASHLGITYQSYQRMEAGKSAFRASTLNRLGQLYSCETWKLVEGKATETDPDVIRALWLLHGLDPEQRQQAIAEITKIKQG